MKIPNKRGLQHIACTNSLDIDFQDFQESLKKMPIKLYYFLMNDTTLTSDNLFTFQKKNFRKNTETNQNN